MLMTVVWSLAFDLRKPLEEAAQGHARSLLYCEQVPCVILLGVVFLEVILDLVL